MNGEQLYKVWAQLNDDAMCMIDEWGELDKEEQDLWNEFARVLAV